MKEGAMGKITSRALKTVYFSLILVCLVGGSGLAGFFVGRRSEGNVPGSLLHPFSNQVAGQKQVDFNVFWQAWNILDNKFYGKIDNTSRVDGSIAGMVAGLKDPYTVYLEPKANNLFRSDLQGNFGGIGAELEVKNTILTIVSVLEGTPSEKAGLKAGDLILEVDGKKTSELSFNDAVNKIRGTKGTQVVLTIAREKVDKPLKISVTRDTIVVKSVKTSAVGPNNSIAYIKVNQFGQDTTDLFQTALQQAKTDQKKGLIIDLRNDPGGYLDAAVQMIGMLIPANPAGPDANLKDRVGVLERSKDGSEDKHRATNEPILDNLPLVVLVNAGSASASEIFSGAMRDYKRGTLVGTKTFGKGSVQQLENLSNGGSIKVTVAKWFTPLGVGIDGKGLLPDITAELPDGVIPSTTDDQMTKAIAQVIQQEK